MSYFRKRKSMWNTNWMIGIYCVLFIIGVFSYYHLFDDILYVAIVVVAFGCIFLYDKKQEESFALITMEEIDQMTGIEFEKYLGAFFRQREYHVTFTKASNDYGADLVVEQNGKRCVIQTKRYRSNVGNSAIQEVVSAKAYYKAEVALVITNSYFTKNAKVLASVNNVTLWDRDVVKVLDSMKANLF